MPAILVLLFIIVPIVEILVIIQVGQAIGAWWTVGLLVIDSLLGAWLLKREGARTWRAFREALQAGRWPGDEVAQGAMVIVGGTLLLTPGFVTDVVGFILLVPGSRRILSRTVRSRIKGRVIGGSPSKRQRGRAETGPGSAPGAVDVEVVDIQREAWPEAPDHRTQIDGGSASDEQVATGDLGADGRDDADGAGSRGTG